MSDSKVNKIKKEMLGKNKSLQKRSQRIVRSQQYVYVTYMEEHPDFVTNETKEHWKELARRLNDSNGPKKSPEDWKTTFMRWKHQVAYRARQAATGQSKLYKTLTQIDVRALIALGKEIPMNCHIIGETDPSELIEMHAKKRESLKSEPNKSEASYEAPEDENEEQIKILQVEEEEEEDEEEDDEDEEEDEYVQEPKRFRQPVKTYQVHKRKAPIAESTRIINQAAPSNMPEQSRATSPDSPEYVSQVRPLDDRQFQLKKREVLALERRAMAQERIADAFERIVNVLESRFERDLPDLL
ncbi:ran GTPase-activating protein 1-like [Phlebotomus argentipes]|uniref:ran GTPase-activating protein 1-like n=1 Tax=Phlebotomus argentipes TaxID=94469 RepID=UPI002892B106|nr:ran GTPase-activating protein 1-like [Phlebotomus argentipes]